VISAISVKISSTSKTFDMSDDSLLALVAADTCHLGTFFHDEFMRYGDGM
jgi:hypothetical protein